MTAESSQYFKSNDSLRMCDSESEKGASATLTKCVMVTVTGSWVHVAKVNKERRLGTGEE